MDHQLIISDLLRIERYFILLDEKFENLVGRMNALEKCFADAIINKPEPISEDWARAELDELIEINNVIKDDINILDHKLRELMREIKLCNSEVFGFPFEDKKQFYLGLTDRVKDLEEKLNDPRTD